MEIPACVASQNFATAAADAPVMVLLHGYGSHEHDLPGIAAWLPRHLPWVSVRAPLAMGGGAAAWFPLTLPDEPSQTPVDEATEALWSFLDQELGDRTVIPVGFSQGGLMATQLLRTRPQQVAATVVLAGFITEEGERADAGLSSLAPSVFWGRGESDGVIWDAAVERTERWLTSHTSLTSRVYAGLGHSVSEQELLDVGEFLRSALR
ncbi:alpha/beta hydrolase [Demequina flava]|uniref:alpha/beta hydrolase n=1 Tax=Demequina flava TaxID=1095025 RepID=UPI000780E850|nr:dienelactone hydrolase family protein [Demequina flava]